ncbi:unnamed protein product [Phaeothamnion confervicola]
MAQRPLRVVVTGGSRGIGRAIVDAFAKEGHAVLFTYNRSVFEAIEEAKCYAPAGRVKAVHLDQGDFQQVQKVAALIASWLEGDVLDVLVNSAALGSVTVEHYCRDGEAVATASNGKGADGSKHGDASAESSGVAAIAAQRAAEDEALMRVNALGPVWLTEALLPFMAGGSAHAKDGCSDDWSDSGNNGHGENSENGTASGANKSAGPASPPPSSSLPPAPPPSSSLPPSPPLSSSSPPPRPPLSQPRRRSTALFIGSVGGGSQSVFPAFKLADAMSKAALSYAVKCLAARHIHGAIDFVCLCPGATLTDMFRASTLDGLRRPDDFVAALPQRRLIEPAEVAEAVRWLCTCPAARLFHGAVLDASQGLAVRPGVLTEYKGF